MGLFSNTTVYQLMGSKDIESSESEFEHDLPTDRVEPRLSDSRRRFSLLEAIECVLDLERNPFVHEQTSSELCYSSVRLLSLTPREDESGYLSNDLWCENEVFQTQAKLSVDEEKRA